MRNLLTESSSKLKKVKRLMLKLSTTSLPAETLTRLLQVRMPISSDSAPKTMTTSMVAAVENVVELEVVVVTTGVAAIVAVEDIVVVEKASQSLTKTTMRLSQLSEAVVPAQAAMKVIVKSQDYSRAFRCEEE